jgi:hypothetical protein
MSAEHRIKFAKTSVSKLRTKSIKLPKTYDVDEGFFLSTSSGQHNA